MRGGMRCPLLWSGNPLGVPRVSKSKSDIWKYLRWWVVTPELQELACMSCDRKQVLALFPTPQCLCCSECWAGVSACVGNCTTFPFGWLAVHLKPNDKEETPMDGGIISRDSIIVKWKMSWLSLHIWHDIPGHWGDLLWMCKELCVFFFFRAWECS